MEHDRTDRTPASSAPRPAGRAAQKAATRAAISAAVLDLMEERGFGYFTAEEAARAAGVSRRTFFNHFSSVEEACFSYSTDLMTELTRRAAEGMARGANYLQAMLDGTEGMSTWPELHAAARGTLAWEAAHHHNLSDQKYVQMTWVRAERAAGELIAGLAHLGGPSVGTPGEEERRAYLGSAIVAVCGRAFSRWATLCGGQTGPESLLELERHMRRALIVLLHGNTWPHPQPEPPREG